MCKVAQVILFSGLALFHMQEKPAEEPAMTRPLEVLLLEKMKAILKADRSTNHQIEFREQHIPKSTYKTF